MKVALNVPADFFDLSVNVAVPPTETVCAPPGVTCKSDDLLDEPVIDSVLKLVCAMTTVVVPSKLSETDPGTAVSTHGDVGVGVCNGVGVVVGVGVGVVVGVAVAVGVGVGLN